MKTAAVVLLVALSAIALAHDMDHGHDNDHKKYEPKHDRYNHHSSSSSSSSPEHKYRHHHRRQYKRAAQLTTEAPVFTTTELLPTALPRASDSEITTTILPTTPTTPALPTTPKAAAPRQADAEMATAETTTLATLKSTTPLAAVPRQADFEFGSSSSSSSTTTEDPAIQEDAASPKVIGTAIPSSVSCDFSCKFFTLISSEDGTPVSFNYRTSPDCLQVDASCDEGFTLVTYGKNQAVPLDQEGRGIINCFQDKWFDMNNNDGSNVMCVKNALVNKPSATEVTPVPTEEEVTNKAPIEPTTAQAAIAPFNAQTTTVSH